jgi:hypothetical protein
MALILNSSCICGMKPSEQMPMLLPVARHSGTPPGFHDDYLIYRRVLMIV